MNEEKIANHWARVVEGESGRVREQDIYPRLNEWVRQACAREILDIGAGQGICSSKIFLDGSNYTGIDSSMFLVERANKMYGSSNRRFFLGDAQNLSFEPNSFDTAFSVFVWHLLPDLRAASRELSRVLNHNGEFLIIAANPDNYSIWAEPYSDIKINGRRFDGKIQLGDKSVVREVLYLHTLDEIVSELQRANLCIEKVERFRRIEGSHGLKRFISIQGRKA